MPPHLTSFQEAFVLSVFPRGSAIASARPMQEMQPCPIRVHIALPNAEQAEIVLRIARNRGGVEREAMVLPVLTQLGLPVPSVLAGPESDPLDAQAMSMNLHSMLPGRTLQECSSEGCMGLETALAQTVEAVLRLHALTDRLLDTGIAAHLPRKTLTRELLNVMESANPWVQEPAFAAAAARLLPVVEAIDTPLVFSNGDYQPANFLSDGKQLTGFVDFEKACFEDPLITFSRYPVYELNPLSRAGVVARFLGAAGFSESDFAPRLAIFCLRTLLTKTPVLGGTPEQNRRREHVSGILDTALSLLKQ